MRLAENSEIILFVSEEILEEISEALNRPVVRANLPDLTAEAVEAFLEKLSDLVIFLKKCSEKISTSERR